jgi:hypothetical protein
MVVFNKDATMWYLCCRIKIEKVCRFRLATRFPCCGQPDSRGRVTVTINSFTEKAMSFIDVKGMKPRAAIRILMHSPFYFRMALADRKVLVLEFCVLYGDILQS